MGRPRTPTAVLEVKGSFKKHPERKAARKNEPVVKTVLGDPPARMNAQQNALWHELVEMVPAGVLTFADRWQVELASRLWLKVIEDQASSSELAILMTGMGKMGLNPADRSKISIPKQPDEKDEFAEFAAPRVQ